MRSSVRSLSFKDLALVVIDEEQRFGSGHKSEMRALSEGLHVLAMTATPIPRTLEAGFVGLSDLSIIATPPVRRSPVRTEVGPFDDETVAKALSAEHDRGGQSFVVCPRIDDLEPMAEKLADIAPDQTLVMLHGRMKPEEVEDAMLAFANGSYDILLATTIVESGLDVANANTMIVCRANRFGLAELHQLRGRVGRGVSRGHVLLTTQAGEEIGEEADKRLRALMEFDALGSGFDIAARDLDLRGTGDLLGDEQAGHLQTIGIALYRKTLERAIEGAKGNLEGEEIRPQVSIGLSLSIPSDYVTEPDLRIEIANLLERVEETSTLGELRVEIEDRFGPMPSGLETSFALAELRLRCARLGVAKLDLGPKAGALSFTPSASRRLEASNVDGAEDGVKWSKQRLVFAHSDAKMSDPIAEAERILDRLEGLLPAVS
ncbi:helicase-related protein [Jiella pelagia]|uniref:Helicase-related protein n=1 Tax=Jiella pelagia TaxID=2986949 RepID=A0ABY7BW65_9HYPH|nr:helicase-related protein [Jiella pelagia]WAP66748.1 helicase-related protein [Jiella pelagia]